jgi:hypothetical protein
VDPEVGDGLGASAASTEVGSGENRDRAEDSRAGTRDGEAHGAAIAPAEGEQLGRVDAQIPLVAGFAGDGDDRGEGGLGKRVPQTGLAVGLSTRAAGLMPASIRRSATA